MNVKLHLKKERKKLRANSQTHQKKTERKVGTQYRAHTTCLLKMRDVSKGKASQKRTMVEAMSISKGGSNSCQ